MAKTIIIGANREIIKAAGTDLEDVLEVTTADQAEAIALRLSELTEAKSREHHPLKLIPDIQ